MKYKKIRRKEFVKLIKLIGDHVPVTAELFKDLKSNLLIPRRKYTDFVYYCFFEWCASDKLCEGILSESDYIKIKNFNSLNPDHEYAHKLHFSDIEFSHDSNSVEKMLVQKRFDYGLFDDILEITT